MDSEAWAILAKLLDMAADEFSNHSCNDFTLPNTPDNRALVLNASDDEDMASYINYDAEEICTYDWLLMRYFADKARELSEKG